MTRILMFVAVVLLALTSLVYADTQVSPTGHWTLHDTQTNTPDRGVTIAPATGGGVGYTYTTAKVGTPPVADTGTLVRVGTSNTFTFESNQGGGSGVLQYDESTKKWAWQNNQTGAGGTMD
jgi:hypothetical protein